MAGHAMCELAKTAQKRLLRLREQAHVHRALTAAQNRAQGDDQNLMEVVQRSVPRTRIIQPVPARDKFLQNNLPSCDSLATG